MAPLCCHLHRRLRNGPTSWSWDLRRRHRLHRAEPSHTFSGGSFTVALTATNDSGSSSESKAGYIQATTFTDVPPTTGPGSKSKPAWRTASRPVTATGPTRRWGGGDPRSDGRLPVPRPRRCGDSHIPPRRPPPTSRTCDWLLGLQDMSNTSTPATSCKATETALTAPGGNVDRGHMSASSPAPS